MMSDVCTPLNYVGCLHSTELQPNHGYQAVSCGSNVTHNETYCSHSLTTHTPGTNEDGRTLNPFIAWTYWPNLFPAAFYGLLKRIMKLPLLQQQGNSDPTIRQSPWNVCIHPDTIYFVLKKGTDKQISKQKPVYFFALK
jgi:hypothetical protein